MNMQRGRYKRAPSGFNLAFLDIMACGLGAIILIFMLVKYHVESPASVEVVTELQNELASIQNEVSELESGNAALESQLNSLKQNLQQEIARTVQTESDASAAAKALIALTKEIAALESKLKNKTKTPTEAPPKTSDDHLIGLRVSGARILILLDNSASMADERLVDIIKIKVGDTAAKKSAPKWQRALAVTEWMLEQAPATSDYLVVHYNAAADYVGAKKWSRADDETARAQVDAALEKLYPHGATDLHAALKLANAISPRPTDVYIITDSLPTKGKYPVTQKLTCGLGNKNNISGECRAALFSAAVKSFKPNAAVNTVLLPVEGDPDAAAEYWLWSAGSGGTMISPAANWP